MGEVEDALKRIEPEINRLWTGNGIDGRRVHALLKDSLASWEMERAGNRQGLTWVGSAINPVYVDAQRGGGHSILEVEGGGALQNNRLHRDLLAAMLLDDVTHLVLVVPNWVHGRSPFEYAVAFSKRLREKRLLPADLTVTVFGYGSPPRRS